MKRLVIFALVLLFPSVVSEIAHSPDKVGEGDQFTALIDTEDNVVSVTFYVCTLEEPYTCYKPETVERNDTVDGRFQFTYEVKNNDYPGYKYELEKDDNSTDKIPASEYSYYEGMNVVKMGDSYYFKVNIKSQDSEDEALLYSPSIISSISILVILVLAGRR